MLYIMCLEERITAISHIDPAYEPKPIKKSICSWIMKKIWNQNNDNYHEEIVGEYNKLNFEYNQMVFNDYVSFKVNKY